MEWLFYSDLCSEYYTYIVINTFTLIDELTDYLRFLFADLCYAWFVLVRFTLDTCLDLIGFFASHCFLVSSVNGCSSLTLCSEYFACIVVITFTSIDELTDYLHLLFLHLCCACFVFERFDIGYLPWSDRNCLVSHCSLGFEYEWLFYSDIVFRV